MTNSIETLTAVFGLRVAAGEAGSVRGAWQGEGVELVPDGSVPLEDLAEEIGMAVAFRGDRLLLDRRRLRLAGRLDDTIVERLHRFRRDLPQLPDIGALQHLAARIEALEHFGTDDSGGGDGEALRERILSRLREYDPDVTHQHAALELLLTHLDDSRICPRLRQALESVRAWYEVPDRLRDVRAGLAAALPAAEGAARIGADPADIRSAYRRMIAGVDNLADLFRLLRGFDLSRSFVSVIALFTRAATRDLASARPSTDRDRICALLAELGRLRKVKSVLHLADDLLENASRHLAATDDIRADALDIAEGMLDFAGKTRPGLEDARALLDTFAAVSLSARIVFANGLRDLHAELPADVVPSLGAHLRQKAALLRMLEGLVAAEERELGDQTSGG